MTILKENDRTKEHCAERAPLSQAVSNAITEALSVIKIQSAPRCFRNKGALHAAPRLGNG
jgi:hypothetical protein